MGAAAADVMKVASSFIGTKESPANSNNVSFNTHYYGHAVSGADYPWCCVFLWDVFRMAGAADLFLDGNKTAYCPTYESWVLGAGLEVGKDSGEYGDVATMDFGKGRASHIGLILARLSDGTYQTIEGNTSTSSEDNGGAVMVRVRSKDVIRHVFRPKYAKEIEMSKCTFTQDQWISAVKAVYKMAHDGGYVYADSTAMPPCSDKKISCDRLEARALYNLGMKDQRKGGEVCGTFPAWFDAHGATKITNRKKLQGGDICYVDNNGKTSAPDATWHMFTIVSYDPKTGMCHKYDMGSNDRIKAAQPFYCQLEDQAWAGMKHFKFAYRMPYVREKGTLDGTYVIESAVDRSFCLDADKNTTNVQLWKKSGNAQQKFVLEYVSDGYYRIRNTKAGKVVDVKSGKAVNRQNIQQYNWNATKAQLWKPQKNSDGSYTFISAINKSYVLDLRGGQAGKGHNIQLYKSNGTAAQKWYLVKV